MLMNLAIHQENRVWWGWTLKGSHGYFTDEVENTSFSLICGFSENKFYGLIVNKETNTHHTFKHFLIKLIKLRELQTIQTNDKYWIIYDNASIHKTKSIKELATKMKIRVLTIPPYCPVLNAAENFILSIKKKIIKYNEEGR